MGAGTSAIKNDKVTRRVNLADSAMSGGGNRRYGFMPILLQKAGEGASEP
jgi:hypothetical protein